MSERSFEKIKEGSTENQEAVLKEKILHLQLEYAQRLFENREDEDFSPSEKIGIKPKSFYEAINNFTDLSKKIEEAYNQWKGEPFWGQHYQEFQGKYKEIVSNIEEEYKKIRKVGLKRWMH